MSVFQGSFTGLGILQNIALAVNKHKNPALAVMATFNERIPPPTGVVNGPLIETTYSPTASNVSSGSQVSFHKL